MLPVSTLAEASHVDRAWSWSRQERRICQEARLGLLQLAHRLTRQIRISSKTSQRKRAKWPKMPECDPGDLGVYVSCVVVFAGQSCMLLLVDATAWPFLDILHVPLRCYQNLESHLLFQPVCFLRFTAYSLPSHIASRWRLWSLPRRRKPNLRRNGLQMQERAYQAGQR